MADRRPGHPGPDVADHRVVVDGDRPSGAQDPSDFPDEALGVRDVAQEVCREHTVDRGVREGLEVLHGIRHDELDAHGPRLRPGLKDHAPGGVDAADGEEAEGAPVIGPRVEQSPGRGPGPAAQVEDADRPVAGLRPRQPLDEELRRRAQLCVVAGGERHHRVVGRCGPVEGGREPPFPGALLLRGHVRSSVVRSPPRVTGMSSPEVWPSVASTRSSSSPMASHASSVRVIMLNPKR